MSDYIVYVQLRMICAVYSKYGPEQTMAEKFDVLSDELATWIRAQHIFFVATAATDGHINLSPKGQDSLKVLSPKELLWLNLTGSGNETAAHLRDANRLTLMWCAFDRTPRILRIYGQAETVHPRDKGWEACVAHIPPPLGARQYFKVQIDLVQTSCGYAVPFMDFKEDRRALTLWSEKHGQSGIEDYWQNENLFSLDGHPTGINS